MNIKNRIKNVERKMGITSSEYCACHDMTLTQEILPISIDEWKRRADAGEETMVKLPDACPECCKPFDRRFIEVTYEQACATVQARLDQVAETMAKFAD